MIENFHQNLYSLNKYTNLTVRQRSNYELILNQKIDREIKC